MGCGAPSRPAVDVPAEQHQVLSPIPNPAPADTSAPSKDIAKFDYEEKVGKNGKDYVQIINKECSLVRLDFCKEIKSIPITGKKYDLTLQYCYVSQKGYYPNALGKANQDSYVVCESMLGDKSCNLFGIFDGHGEYGDFCSYYTADKLPKQLVSELKSNGGLGVLDEPSMTEVYTKAFVNTNTGLHDSKIDDSLSGTTAVTILQKGDKLLVANVGDSRAIIASEVDGRLKYSPLSIDQTPYRKDERERLKKAGAKIMTMDQLEGNEPLHENFGTELGEEIDEGGDPPRVWDSSLERPGCAFSRSVGDAVAKKVGVTAEPEILEWELSPKDRFAVIASDGVFEFITSQHVVDMINKHPNKLEAAKQVVAEAYRLWLTYDDRTDDISIIILIFDNIKQRTASATNLSGKPALARMTSLSHALSSENLLRENNRPVRKVLSKARRKDIADDWNKQDSSTVDVDHLENTKSEEEIARLSEMLSTSFMFQNLSPIQKDLVYTVMQSRDVVAGELIIKEGDKGDEMYIVDSGLFVVYKKDENGKDEQVFQYTEAGSAFGELSLMYGKPRGASVVAKTEGRLWSISRGAFRAIMMKDKNQALLDIFQTIPVLNELSIPALHRLCLASKEVRYQKGDLIVEERTVDNSPYAFCVVITGVIALIPMDDLNKKRQLRAELSYLSFAEIGTKFRHAIADNDAKISCIPKLIFKDILGEKGTTSMKDTMLKSKAKGKRLQAIKSPFTVPENMFLAKYSEMASYSFDHAVAVLGEFGYTGNFKQQERVYSVKVIAKSKANKARMDKRVVAERNYLAVFANTLPNSAGLPFVVGTFQDEKFAFLIFRDHFVCDLALAINSQAIAEEDAKVYFIACLYSAIRAIHRLGLIHRLINPSSIFITRGGNVKLVDYRFAKRMDGAPCFTICGDPLYFAPEMVLQQGYDYSVDIWALGIIVYELFEGNTPFGNSETDETSIFRAISKFRPSKLSFTNKTHESARSLLMDILQFSADTRAGYQHEEDILEAEFFLGIDWDDLQNHKGYPVDIQPSIDLANHLDLQSVSNFSGTAFEQF